jgi:hypothetical protein
MDTKNRKPSIARHKVLCSVCAHLQRAEIEREFVTWGSPERIATEYDLGNRATIYRHAHAMGLFEKRNRNHCAALARLIEQADNVPVVSASVIVQAVVALEKIQAQGKFEEPDGNSRSELYECMSLEECKKYAEDGTLPNWYKKPNELPSNDSGGGENE